MLQQKRSSCHLGAAEAVDQIFLKMTGLIASAAVAALLLSAPSQASPVVPNVDVELALGVDVSGSVDGNEYLLQMQGYVDAFRTAAVQNAILSTANGRLGSIAAALYQWSSFNEQVVSVGWSLLDSVASIETFATQIENTVRAFGSSTAVGNAIGFGAAEIARNNFEGVSKVIDISGDGEQNDGIDTSDARDAALLSGVTRINGIAIGSDSLLAWYKDNVIGGKDAFALQATGFDTFDDAIKRKLEAEITGGPGTIPLPAAGWLLIAGLGGLAALRRRKQV